MRRLQESAPPGAVDFEQEDPGHHRDRGRHHRGYRLLTYAASHYGEYGGGRYADVIDGLQFERLPAPRARHGEPRRRLRRQSAETVVSSSAPAS